MIHFLVQALSFLFCTSFNQHFIEHYTVLLFGSQSRFKVPSKKKVRQEATIEFHNEIRFSLIKICSCTFLVHTKQFVIFEKLGYSKFELFDHVCIEFILIKCWSVISTFNPLNRYSNKNVVRSPSPNSKLHKLSKDSEAIPDFRTNQGWHRSKGTNIGYPHNWRSPALRVSYLGVSFNMSCSA